MSLRWELRVLRVDPISARESLVVERAVVEFALRGGDVQVSKTRALIAYTFEERLMTSDPTTAALLELGLPLPRHRDDAVRAAEGAVVFEAEVRSESQP